MAYRARGRRVVLTEFRGSRTRDFLEKAIGPGTHVQRVDVGGAPGIWISGRPHEFVYADASGEIRPEALQPSGPVLVWERSGVVLRLAGLRSRTDAIRIAEAVRRLPRGGPA